MRVIGDDSNMIREFPSLPGRIYSVAISDDGKRIAAGSSLDGTGEVRVYSYEFDTTLPPKIKAIQEKVVTTRSAEEARELDKYHKDGVKQIANVKIPQGAVYAVAFGPGGKAVAAAGSDGKVRLINVEDGSLIREFAPVTVTPRAVAQNNTTSVFAPQKDEPVETETLPDGTSLTSLEITPKEVFLNGRFTYNQIVVIGKLASGESLDLTRTASPFLSTDIADVSRSGVVRPRKDGKATLT